MQDSLEVIDAHAKLADYYRYRTPYLRGMFDALKSRLPLHTRDNILDICCGSGELAAGLSPLVNHIVAIDGSPEMLALARLVSNVDYHCHDINQPGIPRAVLSDEFKHFFIGRAIHWISVESLESTVGSSLAKDGAIVICASGWTSNTPWLGEFNKIRNRFSSGRTFDWVGKSKLAAIGFSQSQRVAIRKTVYCDLDYLVKNALSYADSGANILEHLQDFRESLASVTAKHTRNGKLTGEIISWAWIYRLDNRLSG